MVNIDETTNNDEDVTNPTIPKINNKNFPNEIRQFMSPTQQETSSYNSSFGDSNEEIHLQNIHNLNEIMSNVNVSDADDDDNDSIKAHYKKT